MIKETHIVKYVNLKNTLITNLSNTARNIMRIRHCSCAINAKRAFSELMVIVGTWNATARRRR